MRPNFPIQSFFNIVFHERNILPGANVILISACRILSSGMKFSNVNTKLAER